MNENLNLIEILKDCPEGTKLYSPVFGEVKFESINDIIGPIIVTTDTGNAECFTADGKMYTYYNGECLLFPSKDQRDWGKFTAPWLEKQDKKSSWKPSKEEMDVLYSLSYLSNEYDEHKEDVITRLYQDLKREFFNGSSYENMFSIDNKEDDVRRRSTIQVLEYARSLDAYNQYGKADIDKNIAWLKQQGETPPILSHSSNTGKNKPKFDPKTLKPFDKVLTRRGSESYNAWFPDFISDPPNDIDDGILCMCNKDDVTMVIPYNEDTKHLVCTNKEAPEYYRYWED